MMRPQQALPTIKSVAQEVVIEEMTIVQGGAFKNITPNSASPPPPPPTPLEWDLLLGWSSLI